MIADVICLANARKRSERCVAGLRAGTGEWIRLVSRAQHGELTFAQRRLGEHGEPKKLDLMRVRLSGPRPVAGQPENWLIEDVSWELLERPAGNGVLRVFLNAVHGGDLLFGSTGDRIAASSFTTRPANASLALVVPADVRWVFETIGSKQRARANFKLGVHRYNLSVTDPPVEEKLKSLTNGTHNSGELGLDEERLLFCISLGEPFLDGNCYKLVAGVIQLP